MSAKVMSVEIDDSPVPTPESASQEVDCGCCGFKEECTPPYIAAVRARHGGKWICGLCAEAVKEEIRRAAPRWISPEEAVVRHARSHIRPSPAGNSDGLISALRCLLVRRGLKSLSAPGTPRRAATFQGLARSESCVPALSTSPAKVEASSGSEYSDDL